MSSGTGMRRRDASACWFAVFFFCGGTALADQGPRDAGPTVGGILTQAGSHQHDPIDVDARPIVSRSKVSLIRPRRMLLEPDGSLVVADWGAGTVIRVSSEEKATIIATGLNEPAGLTRDASGNLFVTTHAGGMTQSGSVVRIAPSGVPTVIATGLTGPTAIAFDPSGNLVVANFHDDSIARITPQGQISTWIDDIPAPSALVFDAAGVLYAASSTDGTIFRINPMGEVSIHARGLQIPSDLAIDPEGHLIVANFGGTELSHIDAKGQANTFAVVPKGTIAHVFDPAGNLLLLNWEYQFLMKVTMHLSVPCPHCGKPIPLRLRPRTIPAEKPRKEPVI